MLPRVEGHTELSWLSLCAPLKQALTFIWSENIEVGREEEVETNG